MRILRSFLLVFLFLSAVPPLQAVTFDLADPGWKLSGGEGRRLENVTGAQGTVLELTGDGKHSTVWALNDIPVVPGKIGLVRYKVRRVAGSGGGMTGMNFANFDVSVPEKWETKTLIFKIPEGEQSGTLRLGQWNAAATLQFAECEFLYLTPVFNASGLGDDESVTEEPTGKVYRFTSAFGGSQGNYSRTLDSTRVWFNSDRWCFGTNTELLYHFRAADVQEDGRFFGGKFEFTVGYYAGGSLLAEYSTDGESWSELAVQPSSGTQIIDLPAVKGGAENVWIRFRGLEKSNLQLNSMKVELPLSPTGPTAQASKENTPIGTQAAGTHGFTCFWELVDGDEGFEALLPPVESLPKKVPGEQVFEKKLTWKDAQGAEKTATVRCRYYVAEFYREDYGQTLDVSSDALGVWTCEAPWKIYRKRALPIAKAPQGTGLKISAARNDYESVQLVLKPKVGRVLKNVTISTLKNRTGEFIAPENVTVRDEFFHFVDHPTDATAVKEFYPDALPPLVFPKTLEAGLNAPLWLTVYVPFGTQAGDYAATVTLTLDDQTVEVPLALHVWDFDVPKRNHSESGYGFYAGTAYTYHGAKTDEDRRKIQDMYFAFIGKYRLSVYSPEGMDSIRYNFIVDEEKPENSRCEVDFSKFDPAMEKAVKEYGCTNFTLHFPGMGGGTFHDRYEPEIKGFGENTVEYQAMFSSMVRQVEAHLKEKGWIRMAYVYWFDEPDVKDYEFVKNGMNRIKKYAPEIQTMLTEEPSEDVIAGSKLGKIDIWCPVTPNFNEELANKCREKGERFWWYVCCWPHAPYCTEFTDHPAVELRTWYWQTWKYDVVGTLIWTLNWWTSNTAFPNEQQNPYLDPMSYVSGYDTPPGTKRFWGNGDGRLFYPPLSCATPNTGETPNFDEPVASMRLEMLREGCEDFEFLWLLREKLKTATPEQRAKYEKLLTVPEEITASMTEFSKDPAPIYRHRKAVAEAIEAME
ncbi:MAG: DUF4091 domain-containing protein [Thermoguttaceae bacterium]|nr:DUF4091 domain-containing protein [Thermoguttaceae bacterium]